MNPSYNSGSSDSSVNTPGVKPGVIASGPDPADAPAPQPLSTPSPTMTPRKKLRLPTGGRSGSIPTIGGSSRGGSKKGLIIGALVAIVVLIVVLVVVLLMGGGKGGGGNGSINANFNKLINYVANGNESTADISGEYSATGNYYFLNGWDTEEEKTTIYNKTKNLIDNFYASYKDGDNQTLNNLVKSTKDQFDFMYVVDLKDEISEENIVGKISTMNDDELKQLALRHYNLSDLKDNIYAKNFSEAYELFVDTLIGEARFFKENGCVTKDTLDPGCMAEKKDENLINMMKSVFEDTSTAYDKVNSYYNMERNFVANLYDINVLLNGGSIANDTGA